MPADRMHLDLSQNFTVEYCCVSRQNPFGLTVALDEAGNAFGDMFYDDGETIHTMEAGAYHSSITFEGVSLTWRPSHSKG